MMVEESTCIKCGKRLHWIESSKNKERLKGILICYTCNIFLPVLPAEIEQVDAVDNYQSDECNCHKGGPGGIQCPVHGYR